MQRVFFGKHCICTHNLICELNQSHSENKKKTTVTVLKSRVVQRSVHRYFWSQKKNIKKTLTSEKSVQL